MKLALITPTRNRPECFRLLEQYVKAQTVQPDKWIVVNDGSEPYEYTMNQKVCNRQHDPDCGLHSICCNYLEALDHLDGDEAFLCLEDDDIYFPRFLEEMAARLADHDLVGCGPAHYLNFQSATYANMGNGEHCSLANTAFTPAVVPLFKEIALRGDPYIDLALWSEWGGSKVIFPNEREPGLPLTIGGKCLWGEKGIGWGHSQGAGRRDPGLAIFRRWLGPYWSNYYDGT